MFRFFGKTKEEKRLEEHRKKKHHWRRFGPYLTEREWGCIREDYSDDKDVWSSFPFDQASYRTYHWGEDGIAGFCDNHQKICFSFAFWNENDEILKERLFGFSGPEGNHGEDVKEYYFYLDGTPTHSYMKYLYKYPHEAFPYQLLKEKNKERGRFDPEYELLDTGIFSENKYFDIFIEYAKKNAEDLLIKVTIENRSKERQKIHILPTLVFRNIWQNDKEAKKPILQEKNGYIEVIHPDLTDRFFYFEKGFESVLFTENETNLEKYEGKKNPCPYVKDGLQSYVIEGKKQAVNPENKGTKAAPHYIVEIEGQSSVSYRFRLTDKKQASPFKGFDKTIKKRIKEADSFYKKLQPKASKEMLLIQRQAFAGLLWSKQFYYFIVDKWQKEGGKSKQWRNQDWIHVYNEDILSMPDQWEYPWYAAWDLAFHMIPFSIIDPGFAKRQLIRLTREWYMHPNGQLPSYEWNFGDVNPPVHAWAAYRTYKIEEKLYGKKDQLFLSAVFQKLLLNFTWWVNRKDSDGKNVFQGGFLGLDNISVFNRSEDIPKGGSLTQSDATSWMGMYSLNMLTIAIELSKKDKCYEDMASKFFEHFLYIADAINFEKRGEISLWDEEDGFYYDVLHYPDGTHKRLKVHSMVGIIPLFAVAVFEKQDLEIMVDFKRRYDWFLKNREDLCHEVACMMSSGKKGRHLLAIVDTEKLKKILAKMLSEEEFFSPYGIRSISKFHQNNPFILDCDGQEHRIDYDPGESTSGLFGGNSNWRGPIWFPLNFLIIESLQKFYHFYGDDFKVECPTGSNNFINLKQVADEISQRLIKLFSNRSCFSKDSPFHSDPYWKDLHLFHEYFHADNGQGLGASHQTGWTALIAKLIQQQGYKF